MSDSNTCPKNLLLVRHAFSEGNQARMRARELGLEEIEIAKEDEMVGLTDIGKSQAQITGRYIAEKFPPIDAIFCSPYRRTRDTMQIILGQLYELGCAMPETSFDKRLREREFGEWQRLTDKGIEKRYPEHLAKKKEIGRYKHKPPGEKSESPEEVGIRILNFTNEIFPKYAGKNLLFVSHLKPIELFVKQIENIPVEMFNNDHTYIKNCSLIHYMFDEKSSSFVKLNFNYVPWEQVLQH